MGTKGLWIIGGLAGLLAFTGCSSMMGKKGESWTLSVSPKTPAAEGHVHVTAAKDGNQTVAIEVEHMATPDKAFSGATVYVAWLIPPGGGPPQNLGILSIGEDLKGKLTAITPYKMFDILVTAEAQPNVTAPSGDRVMSATVHVPT
jgi:hypothetical protein